MPKCSSYLNDISSLRQYKHKISLFRHINARQSWYQEEELNCIPTGRMEESTWSSSDYWHEDSPTWPEVIQAHNDCSTQHVSEPATPDWRLLAISDTIYSCGASQNWCHFNVEVTSASVSSDLKALYKSVIIIIIIITKKHAQCKICKYTNSTNTNLCRILSSSICCVMETNSRYRSALTSALWAANSALGTTSCNMHSITVYNVWPRENKHSLYTQWSKKTGPPPADCL